MAIIASPALNSLAQHLALIVGDVFKAVAWRGGRDHSMIPFVNAACLRLRKAVQLFERLLAGMARGRKPPARRPGGTRKVAARDPAAFRLPRGYLWLVARIPETASLASQLRHFLEQPEMTALLASEPRAGRILRPVCRMLGIANPGVGTREPASVTKPKPAPKPALRPAPAFVAPAAPVLMERPARWVVWRRSD